MCQIVSDTLPHIPPHHSSPPHLQLDREIAAGGWYIVNQPVNSTVVFDWPHTVCLLVLHFVFVFGFGVALQKTTPGAVRVAASLLAYGCLM